VPDLPRISGADAIRTLQRLGFTQARQRGSHVVLKRMGRGCVVPLHRELKVGTLAGLLKQAGVTPDDFTAAWRGHDA
jgi:predicted RNA binding protein YcfA (HicA-like mRNA interferase family)